MGMAVHKLQIDDFVTIDYELIAIHSSLEDYRLAYFLNKNLRLLLEKCPNDIEVTQRGAEGSFSRFIYEDPENDMVWNLMHNKSVMVTTTQQNESSLFGDTGIDIATGVYLLPEFKKVDYILKVENTSSFFNTKEVVENLLALSHVTTAYTINHNKLKSKNNLIF